MHVEVFVPEAWERLNDSLKLQFQIPVDQQLKVYRGLGAALAEVCQGLTQFYSHKRSLAVLKGTSPHFDFLLPHYIKEAYQIQTLNRENFFTEKTDWNRWVDELKKDTVVVLASEDHPVTGEIFDLDPLDELLNEKKIFFLRLSHSRHHFEPLDCRPYTARLCAWSLRTALVRMGSKIKPQASLSSVMDWNSQEVLLDLQRKPKIQSVEVMEKFEEEMKDFLFYQKSQMSNPTKQNRLRDRCLLHFPEVSGDRFLHHFQKSLGAEIWTPHLCSWSSLKMFKSWWAGAPSPEILRDLVVIGAEAVEKKNLAKELKSTYENLRAEQSWEF